MAHSPVAVAIKELRLWIERVAAQAPTSSIGEHRDGGRRSLAHGVANRFAAAHVGLGGTTLANRAVAPGAEGFGEDRRRVRLGVLENGEGNEYVSVRRAEQGVRVPALSTPPRSSRVAGG